MNFDLTLLAQVVGNSLGIQVVRGNRMFIRKDGGRMVIALPPMAEGDELDADILRGGLAHEAVGHGRHTDFDAKRGPTPLHLAMESVIEDARIERAAWGIYPKTRNILEKSIDAMHQRKMLKRAVNSQSPADVATTAVLVRLMVDDLGYCPDIINWKEDWKVATDLFGEHLMNEVYAIALSGSRTGSTGEVIAFAARAVDLLQKQPPPPPPQEPESGSDEDDSEDKSPDESPSDGAGDSGTDDDDAGESDDKSTSDGAGDSDSGEDEADDKSGDQSQQGQAPGTQPSVGDVDQDQDSSQGSASGQSRVELGDINPDEFDRGNTLSVMINAMPRDPKEISVAAKPQTNAPFIPSATAKTAAMRLKSGLMQKLMSVVEDEDDAIVDRGSLAGHLLVDAHLGCRDVFVEPGNPGEELNTAIDIMIDMSDSMRGVADDACLAAAWSMGDVMHGYSRMGISYAISAFNSWLIVLKDWNEPWYQGKPLSAYDASGSTWTVAAVKNRLPALIKRPEKRKVLFLVTDGDIGNLEPLVNSAKQADIEFVVLMIHDDPNQVKPHYIRKFSIVHPNDIGQSMMKVVTELF